MDAARSVTSTFDPEPLQANAGDDQTVVQGTEVTLDGSASRPSGGIDSYTWDFGEGAPANSVVARHTYSTPGTYTAHLTVGRGAATDTDDVTVVVRQTTAAQGLNVTVNDFESHSGLSGADVLVIDSKGVRYSAVTDSSGHATLDGFTDGAYTIYASADGHRPNAIQATLVDGAGLGHRRRLLQVGLGDDQRHVHSAHQGGHRGRRDRSGRSGQPERL